jgi:hypothetical protein
LPLHKRRHLNKSVAARQNVEKAIIIWRKTNYWIFEIIILQCTLTIAIHLFRCILNLLFDKYQDGFWFHRWIFFVQYDSHISHGRIFDQRIAEQPFELVREVKQLLTPLLQKQVMKK